MLGAYGQVGRELLRELSDLGDVLAVGRADADLSDPQALGTIVRMHRPSVIVNAAAYTGVDKAECEPEIADTVNRLAPAALATEARALGACLVHYSTDYVFDGRKATPYTEADVPNPLSAYGRTKFGGEQAVARLCPKHVILRTSWVFSVHGSNFLKTILRLAAERERLPVVADQFGAPTSAALIAYATRQVLDALLDAPEGDGRWGLYHLSASGEANWYEYARYVIQGAKLLVPSLKMTPNAIVPIGTADYPTAARRPANSRLDTAHLRSTFGVELPDWRRGVDEVLRRLQEEGPK